MNDPTKWNTPDFGSFDVGDPALAKEIEKRWNAYPGIVALLKTACDYGLKRDAALSALRALGEEP